ncbi:MAG: acetyl-CoA carboxylase biotin carboxyl carrier protein [Limisphaerales bacterium]
MDLKDIKGIIDLMRKNSLTEFELEHQDFKIKLKRGTGASGEEGGGGGPYAMPMPVAAPVPSVTLSAATVAATAAAAASAADANLLEIKSPMIGTFYSAPSPESAEYVEVGSEVNPDTVVCLIEAMKVMNEIKAECKGVVTAILVDNAKPVEFGQPLFKIRPT